MNKSLSAITFSLSVLCGVFFTLTADAIDYSGINNSRKYFGKYVGVDKGVLTTVHWENTEESGSGRFASDFTGLQLRAGMGIGKYTRAELNLFKSSTESEDIGGGNQNNLDFMLLGADFVFNYPHTNYSNIIGILGLGYYQMEGKDSAGNTTLQGNTGDITLRLGGGYEMYLTDDWLVRASYLYSPTLTSDSLGGISSFNVGLSYQFENPKIPAYANY